MHNGVTLPPTTPRGFGAVPDVGTAPAARPALADLLDQTRDFVRRFIVFPADEHAEAVALWIVHTHAVEAFDFSPYLSINSPLERCGKSTLLDVLKLTAARAWPVVSPSPAVLFRKIEADCPTLLWDEVDTVFTTAKGDDGREDLRAVLNAGFQRGAKVPRCVGPTHQLAEFSVFCPKALAGIGTLPDTVADRCVVVTLARARPGQKVGKFRHREVAPVASELREALSVWAATPDTLARLAAARPIMPESLGDRQADICEPLLAIADLAGGNWPKRGRAALVRLCAGATGADENLNQKVLSDVREAFATEGEERLPTRRLLEVLIERDDSPWAQWWEADVSRGNTSGPASRLARLLKPFGVASRKYREEGAGLVMGYLREHFEDAFSRYLPLAPPVCSRNTGTLIQRQ